MLGDAVDVGFCGAVDDDYDSRRLSIAGRGIRLGSQWQSLYGPLHEPLYEPLVSVSLSLFRLLHANIHA